MANLDRRRFLGFASLAGAAAGVSSLPARARSEAPATGRRVVGGSPYPTFSRAIQFDRLVFVSGVVGQKPGTRDLASTEFEPQARQVLENLKTSVEAAGSTLASVLKCTCFLTDADDFAVFNQVYLKYFPNDPPARSTVIVKALVVAGAKVEVDCVASV